MALMPVFPTLPPLGPNLKVLLIWPKFPPSFWGFEGVLQMLPEAAMTPPLGLITVAALCPASWSLRLLDHAFDEIRDEDYQWADLVMVSSMHAQRVDTLAVLAKARSFASATGKAFSTPARPKSSRSSRRESWPANTNGESWTAERAKEPRRPLTEFRRSPSRFRSASNW